MRQLICVLLLLGAWSAGAEERVFVCYNYGCYTQEAVTFSDDQLRELSTLLGKAANANEERAAMGEAVGRMLGWAGKNSPISADRGGNFADNAVYGRMDCIDHSTTTTRLLRLLEGRGWLHFHRVLDPALRRRFLVFEHYSAQIEEIQPVAKSEQAPLYVVDSWFFDNGHAATVMPLSDWLSGSNPEEYNE